MGRRGTSPGRAGSPGWSRVIVGVPAPGARPCRKPRRPDRGAVTVEFVLTSVLLFVILFSVVEFAFIFNARLVMAGAAREGARRAAVEGGATAGTYECIEKYLALGNISPEAVTVAVTPRQASYGTQIRVRLVYDYPVMTALLRPIIGDSLTIVVEVVSRGEKVRARHD